MTRGRPMAGGKGRVIADLNNWRRLPESTFCDHALVANADFIPGLRRTRAVLDGWRADKLRLDSLRHGRRQILRSTDDGGKEG